MERKVLHRDISANNILLYPKQHPLSEEKKYLVPAKPLLFIDDILASDP